LEQEPLKCPESFRDGVSFGPRLLPTAMVIFSFGEMATAPILKGTWTGIHWKFARLRKTQEGAAQTAHPLREFARRIQMAIEIDFGCNS